MDSLGPPDGREDSFTTKHTRALLLPPALSKLTQQAFLLLRRDAAPATGAAKAYHESQSRVFKPEAPLFVGVGEGTDNLDFLADLSALKVIDPDEVNRAIPPGDQPVPGSSSRLFEKLKHEGLPYAHYAWCTETPETRSILEEHYYEIHHVVLQPSCCRDTSLVSPELHILDEDESDLNEYMLDPTDPVECLPEQDDPEHWSLIRSAHE